MAGACRPKIEGLREEARYEIIDFKQYSNIGSPNYCGLFDGKLVTEGGWGIKENFYFNDKNSFVEIKVLDNFNLWKYGQVNYLSYNKNLKIERKNNNGYIDITKEVQQLQTNVKSPIWEKCINNLSKGTYRFSYLNDERIDDEWFLEKSTTYYIFIKYNNNIFTIIDNDLVKLENNELNKDNIINNGITDISLITNNVLNENNIDINKITLLFYCDDLTKKTLNININTKEYIPLEILKNKKLKVLCKKEKEE